MIVAEIRINKQKALGRKIERRRRGYPIAIAKAVSAMMQRCRSSLLRD
jgi:hypothetical protein